MDYIAFSLPPPRPSTQAALTQHLGMSGNAMVGMTLPSACLLGVMTSVLNGGCFGLVSALPPVYAQATMTGQALAGFAVACASFVTIWAEGAGEDSLPEVRQAASGGAQERGECGGSGGARVGR